MRPQHKIVIAAIATGLLASCATSGPEVYGGYGAAGQGAVGAAGQAAMGAAVNDAIGAMAGTQNPILAAIIQSMAASVLNGNIGQQLQPADQNFRLQQLGTSLQSGALGEVQEWRNPQTGNSFSLRPVGDQAVDSSSRQNCRELEEVYTATNGQPVREMRRACQNEAGQWLLVQ